jgi:hypothetical protein
VGALHWIGPRRTCVQLQTCSHCDHLAVGPLLPTQDIVEPCSELVAAGPDLVASPSCRAASELIAAPTHSPVAVKEVGADRTHFEVMGNFDSSQLSGQARV